MPALLFYRGRNGSVPVLKIIQQQKILEITPQFCFQNDVAVLLLDIDNTLAVHGSQTPFEGVLDWIENMKMHGIKMIVVSNNHCERVSEFADQLKLPYIYKAAKPLPMGLKKAAKMSGVDKNQIMLIGDQIFTDLLGALFFGIKFVLLEPIEDEKTFFLLWKRRVDRFLRKLIFRG